MRDLAEQDERDRLMYLWLLYSSDLEVPADFKGGSVFCALREKDIVKMCGADLISETVGVANTTVWLLAEPSKKRARIITADAERAAAMDAAGFKSGMTLKHPSQIAADLWQCETLFAVDETKSFYMVKPPTHGYVPVFTAFGKTYQLNRLGMGNKISADVKHMLCTIVGRPPAHLADRIVPNHHIDNSLIGGDDAAVREMFDILMERCKKYNVTLNDNPTADIIGPVQEYCGFIYDAKNKTIAMSPKMRAKFSETAWDDIVSCRNYLQVFSLHLYVARCLYMALPRFYYPLKFARLVGKLIQQDLSMLDADVTVWESIKPLLREWTREILATDAVPIPKPGRPTHATVFVDASDSGKGAVCFVGNDVHVIGERWGDDERVAKQSINAREAAGVSWALDRFGHFLSGLTVDVVVDNNASKALLRKSYSASFDLNVQALKLVEVVRRHCIDVKSVRFCNSSSNCSDIPSRHPMCFQLRRDSRVGGVLRVVAPGNSQREPRRSGLPPIETIVELQERVNRDIAIQESTGAHASQVLLWK